MKATKAKRKPVEAQPGYDGAVLSTVKVRLSATRTEPRAVRCRPGTFEWRYGRDSGDTALYHAGVKFADLWERAGTADARSVDHSGEGNGSGWKGLPDGRTAALDEVKHASRELGKLPTARLSAYCVQGLTAAEVAKRYGIGERTMAILLQEDLRACALHFRYI